MWLLLKCIGRAVLLKGGKAFFNAISGGIAGEALEIAQEAWGEYQRQKRDQQPADELQALAQVTNAEIAKQTPLIVQEIAADQPEEVRRNLAGYLAQVPAIIRRSFRRPSDPTGTTVPPGLVLRKAEDLLPFVPDRLPRFKETDYPIAGVDLELVELLGVGGFGEVWKARNPYQRSDPPVALKFCLDPKAAASLRHEAALLDRVKSQGTHPGIVKLLRTYLRANPPCLEYEFVEGGDLAGLIQEWHRSSRRVQPEKAAKIIMRLAEIVGFAHRLNPAIVHRDLKPANILIQKKGKGIVLKVADFGIGGMSMSQAVAASRGGTMQKLIAATVARGSYTPLYASPQQMAGKEADPRDDVYALGVIWYQLLTCDLHRRPEADYAEDLRDAGVDDRMTALLGQCVAGKAERRPVDANDLAAKLSAALQPGAITVESAVASKQGPVDANDLAAKPPAIEHSAAPTVEQAVPGRLFSRPAEQPEAAWRKIAAPLEQFSPAPGEEYRLVIASYVSDAQLETLTCLRGLTGLKELSLSCCEQVTDAGLAHLRGMTALRELDLLNCNITDAGLAHLRGMTGLQKLALGWFDLSTSYIVDSFGSGTQITDAGLAHLREMTALRELDLLNCNITDAGLARLRGMTGLQKLKLPGCKQVTDAGLAHLRGMTALRELDLIGCEQVTDAGVAALLAALPNCNIVWCDEM